MSFELPYGVLLAGNIGGFRTYQLEDELYTRQRERSIRSRSRISTILNPRRPLRTPVPQNLRSSPVDGDLDKYVTYMKKQKPQYAEDFETAKYELIDSSWTIQLIQNYKGNLKI